MQRTKSDANHQDRLACMRKACKQWLPASRGGAPIEGHLFAEERLGGEAFVCINDAAKALGRPEKSLRRWALDGLIESGTDRSGRTPVRWAGAVAIHNKKPRRNRSAAA